MVVQTQSWDSDLDWLTKTKEMKPEKDEKVWAKIPNNILKLIVNKGVLEAFLQWYVCC